MPREKKFCRSGLHAWVEENLLEDSDGRLRCKLCRRKSSRRHYKRRNKIHDAAIKRLKRRSTRRVDVEVDAELHERMRDMSDESGRTVAEIVRSAMLAACERWEQTRYGRSA